MEKYQIKNADGKYVSIGMGGKPKWFESPDMGYTYTEEEAETFKVILEGMDFKNLSVVKFDKDWWKEKMNANKLAKYINTFGFNIDIDSAKADTSKNWSVQESDNSWNWKMLKKGLTFDEAVNYRVEIAKELENKGLLKDGQPFGRMAILKFSGGGNITSARITAMPTELLDDMPKVYVVINGEEEYLFEYYPDEISFTPEEFIGLTTDEARTLKFEKDKMYLQSHSYDSGGKLAASEWTSKFNSWKQSPDFNSTVFELNEQDIDYIGWTDADIFEWYLKNIYGKKSFAGGGDFLLSTDLYMKEGSHDKEYHLQIAKAGDGYKVVAQWGRRGSHLQEDDKGAFSSYADAESEFFKIKKSKLKKGYVEQGGGKQPEQPEQKAEPEPLPFKVGDWFRTSSGDKYQVKSIHSSGTRMQYESVSGIKTSIDIPQAVRFFEEGSWKLEKDAPNEYYTLIGKKIKIVELIRKKRTAFFPIENVDNNRMIHIEDTGNSMEGVSVSASDYIGIGNGTLSLSQDELDDLLDGKIVQRNEASYQIGEPQKKLTRIEFYEKYGY